MTCNRVVFFVSLLSASCDGCGSCKDKAKAYLERPPPEEYQREIEEQMPTASRQATSMCGFPVKGLANAKVTPVPDRERMFRVEGTPIPKSDAGAPKSDGGTDKAKAAVCIGTMSVIAWPIVGDDNKVTGYKWDPITLESVETPGVKWEKPASGGWD